MAAWGQTSEHSAHSTHLSAFQTGTRVAMRRCSQAVVPIGILPSGEKAETGIRSPRPLMQGVWIVRMNVSSAESANAGSGLAGASGSDQPLISLTLISLSAAIVMSTALILRLTTSPPS